MPHSTSRSSSSQSRDRSLRRSNRRNHPRGRSRHSRGRSTAPHRPSKSRSQSPVPPPAKRRRFFDNHELHRIAGHHVRTVNAFPAFRSVLITGHNRDPERSDNEYTEHENRLVDEYMELCQQLPALHDALIQGGQAEIDSIAAEMQTGASNARSADVKTIKLALADWGDWIPPYKPKKRRDLGFRHPQFGALLCPFTMDWSDPEVRLGLQTGQTKTTTEDFGKFFFPNNEPPSSHLDFPVTFTRGDLCVQAGRAILRGPSSSMGDDPAGHRAGNAELNEMSEATVPTVAWSCTLATHAISSNSSLTATSTTGFNYRRYYNNVINAINDFDDEDRASLLKWWTERLFGDMEPKKVKVTCNGRPRETMLATLKAATAQRKREKAVARAAGSAPVGALAGGTTPSVLASDN